MKVTQLQQAMTASRLTERQLKSMQSRFTPEYLRSVSEYLTILADLKDAENRSKAIQSKLS